MDAGLLRAAALDNLSLDRGNQHANLKEECLEKDEIRGSQNSVPDSP
jgi:hypothetical protein